MFKLFALLIESGKLTQFNLFNITVKPRMSGVGIVPKETRSCLVNLVYLIIFQNVILSDNISKCQPSLSDNKMYSYFFTL